MVSQEVSNKILNPLNWELTSPKERMFTSNHVIDAYFAGHKDGLEQNEKLIMDKLVSNINLSGDFTNELIEKMKGIGVTPTQAYLKINSWDDFTILMVVTEEDFLNENIFNVYNLITEFESSKKSEFFNISVSLLDSDGEHNEDCIMSDGYNFKFKA